MTIVYTDPETGDLHQDRATVIRERALEMALVFGNQGAEAVLADAKLFEAYLLGPTETKD